MLDRSRFTAPAPLAAAGATGSAARAGAPLIRVEDLSLWYGERQALQSVNFDLWRGEVLAFVGPSGCGKTTALKCLNRMHDDERDVRKEGRITFDGADIHAPEIDPPVLRRRFGWVAQKPNPFPTSVWENVACGPRMHGLCIGHAALDAHVEDCLRRAGLWDEVKADVHGTAGTDLSGGQQQRLCIARALSTRPDVLLLDEPTGSIDPIAAARVEALLAALRAELGIVIVTHSMAQAARIADRVAFFHLGRLLELAPAAEFFAAPRTPEGQAFLAGRSG
jgi:phosphate transport system ATP-binding protein